VRASWLKDLKKHLDQVDAEEGTRIAAAAAAAWVMVMISFGSIRHGWTVDLPDTDLAARAGTDRETWLRYRRHLLATGDIAAGSHGELKIARLDRARPQKLRNGRLASGAHAVKLCPQELWGAGRELRPSGSGGDHNWLRDLWGVVESKVHSETSQPVDAVCDPRTWRARRQRLIAAGHTPPPVRFCRHQPAGQPALLPLATEADPGPVASPPEAAIAGLAAAKATLAHPRTAEPP
jgi:hypothetical protein